MKNFIVGIVGIVSILSILLILQISVFYFLILSIIGTILIASVYIYFLSKVDRKLYNELFLIILEILKINTTQLSVLNSKVLPYLQNRQLSFASCSIHQKQDLPSNSEYYPLSLVSQNLTDRLKQVI